MTPQEQEELMKCLRYGSFPVKLTRKECAWLLDVLLTRRIQEMEHENAARRFGPIS